MGFRLAADAVLLLHLGFIAFVLFGALLTLRWRWIPLVHLPAAAWGFFVEFAGKFCPLTDWENALRLRAGQAGYSESFIEHYLLDLIYPAGLTTTIQLVLAGLVALVNGLIYGWLWFRWRSRDRDAS